MLFDLTSYTDISLLLLRLMIAIVFITSGWAHAANPKARAKDIEMPVPVTFCLGVWEMIGALSVGLGFYPQIGAIMLILVMLGAIYKKIFSWHMGFFHNHTDGWHYDVIFLIANLVVLTTAGGNLRAI